MLGPQLPIWFAISSRRSERAPSQADRGSFFIRAQFECLSDVKIGEPLNASRKIDIGLGRIGRPVVGFCSTAINQAREGELFGRTALLRYAFLL
jgi:hypothetical protein